MSAVDRLFEQLRARGQKALMPFVTAGDPDLAFTAAVVRELAGRGCHLCELGVPYSDPIADGPVIQDSYTRALQHHIKLADIFDTVGSLAADVQAPLLTMVSYAIVYRHGLAKYVGELQAAGGAGMIVPDLPIEESAELAKLCRDAELSLVQLITPTTPRERARKIAESSTGFIYYVSVVGITGERDELPPEIAENVAWLREQTPLPICIGFGISRPEHVQVLGPVADGLIVGSAIVKRIATAAEKSREAAVRGIGDYVSELLDALD